MEIDELLALGPQFHSDEQGRPHSFQLSRAMLEFIAGHIGRGNRSLETGAGYSTVVFADRGTEHTCISPDAAEHERITRFCVEHGIPVDGLSFECDTSEHALPRMSPRPLDLVLIDGLHAFPTPFIDWYYTASQVVVGGHLVVDDTDIWTGDVLRRFLLDEPDWEQASDLPPRATAFRRTAAPSERDWREQPFVHRETERLVRRFYMRKAGQLAARGQLVTVGRRGLAVARRAAKRKRFAK